MDAGRADEGERSNKSRRNVIETMRKWFVATSPSTLTSAFSSVTLGAILSFYLLGKINIPFYILTAMGIMMAQAGVNLIHDYSEFKTGLDIVHISQGLPHRIHPIINLGLNPASVKRSGYLLLIAAGLIGIYLAVETTWIILLIAIIGFSLGVLYSEGLRLHYKGAGEAVALISMGPLVALGSFMVQTNSFSWAPVLVGLVNGLFTLIILLGSGAIEIEASRKFGKKTIALMLGLRRTGYLAVAAVAFIYIIIAISVYLGFLPYLSLASLLVLPFSARLVIPLIKGGSQDKWRELKALWAGPFNHRVVILTIIVASIIIARLIP
ncbi:hypothetical protein GCM10007981_15820 [Thermocladium modestius]|uniref:Prenyltransferase n=1 Tax=Thermocladium modestius TaxID=62609 RepID=A0A830GV31_9CREN|nr:prenyltransferase [Thermocladium modestius]GGP21946.1 hypothetical protein GCM10007981_15820 [Thermocladium modestius]